MVWSSYNCFQWLSGKFWLQLNRNRGTLSVYKANIDRNNADLKQAQYKDIDKRYFDQLIQLKVIHKSKLHLFPCLPGLL